VSIFTSAGLIDGRIKNISIGGALIKCKSLPDLDETFNLTIEIPHYFFPVAAKVKKVRLNIFDSEDLNESPSYDLAVRFMDMSEDDSKVFHEAIDRAFRKERSKHTEKKEEPKKSNRIDNSLLMTVEQLSMASGRSFKELLEEALQDLIQKYEKADSKDQSLQL
jgi:flagellar hook-basal body complex protein FliE